MHEINVHIVSSHNCCISALCAHMVTSRWLVSVTFFSIYGFHQDKIESKRLQGSEIRGLTLAGVTGFRKCKNGANKECGVN